jgi:hypothetical protein
LYVYPQLSWQILPFEDNYVLHWSDLIENYEMGPLDIAKNRRYLSSEEGGLGLFEIKTK